MTPGDHTFTFPGPLETGPLPVGPGVLEIVGFDGRAMRADWRNGAWRRDGAAMLSAGEKVPSELLGWQWIAMGGQRVEDIGLFRAFVEGLYSDDDGPCALGDSVIKALPSILDDLERLIKEGGER